MPPVIHVECEDESARAERKAAAERVISVMNPPDASLLCFLDDEDWLPFKEHFGKANRAFYVFIPEAGDDVPWPPELVDVISDGETASFEHLVYLHGSVSGDQIGLPWSLAHEVQHFRQWMNDLPMWAASGFLLKIIKHLPIEVSDDLEITAWPHIPHERDARIVAKRVATGLFSEEEVSRFIDKSVAVAVNDGDRDDWTIVKTLSEDGYDFGAATREIYRRLTPHKDKIFELHHREMQFNPNLKHVELRKLFGD